MFRGNGYFDVRNHYCYEDARGMNGEHCTTHESNRSCLIIDFFFRVVREHMTSFLTREMAVHLNISI
jgi:hypothetical protein